MRAVDRDEEPPEGAAEEPFDLRKRRVDLVAIASVVVPDVDAAPLLVLDPREHAGGQTAVLVGAERREAVAIEAVHRAAELLRHCGRGSESRLAAPEIGRIARREVAAELGAMSPDRAVGQLVLHRSGERPQGEHYRLRSTPDAAIPAAL